MAVEGAEQSTGREQYHAELHGDGAIAQGRGAIALGKQASLVQNIITRPPRPEYTPPSLPERGTLAEHGPLPPGSYLLHRRNPFFTGRHSHLLTLADTLLYEQGNVIVTQAAVASGLGGIGKTQLAVEFAHRYGQFFEGGVYWLNCENPANIPAEVALLGGSLGMGLYQEAEKLTVDEQVGLVQQEWQQATPRLLIFDNCEDVAVLVKWRPVSGGCRVLVTSRQGRWRPELNISHLPLDVLHRSESIALLRQFVPTMTEPEADTIATELGDLPLALHLAGSYLREYGRVVAPTTYLAQLRDHQLLNHPSLQGRGTAHSPTAHELHIGRTFTLSFERLDEENETDAAAIALLACAACFAPGETIPAEWLLEAMEPADEDFKLLLLDGLERLTALGLLLADGESGYQMHRLLATYVQHTLADGMEAAQTAVEETVDREAWALNAAGYPAALLPWQSQLRYVTEKAEARGSPEAHELLVTLGRHLQMLGDYAGAKGPYERALALREQVLGPQHYQTAISLSNLAGLLKDTGDLAAARPLYERALAINEQALWPDHPDIASSLNNLGLLLQEMGELTAARPFLERALAIDEQALGPDDPGTAIDLNNLGLLFHKMGDLAAARPLLERALTIREQTLEPNHPDTAQSLNNLGVLLQAIGDPAAARPLLERALAIREQVLGPQHPDTAESLHCTAFLLRQTGDLAAARPLLERALAIFTRVLGPEHPHTQFTRGNLVAWELEHRDS